MKRMFVYCTIALLLLASGILAEEKADKLALKDLPPAAQKSVQAFSKGGRLIGLTKVEDNGKTVYDVDTLKNGLSRDALINEAGEIIETEDFTVLNKIPGQAKATVEKAAIGGKIMGMTAVTRDSVISYKAVIKKDGVKSEIKVSAGGVILK